MYDKPSMDGRDIVARLFVLESLVLVALGRQMATLKKGKSGSLDKAIDAMHDDVLELALDIKDTVLQGKIGPAVEQLLHKLRDNIDQLSS